MTTPHSEHSVDGVNLDQAFVLVVGAHPQAELYDRPVVEQLRDRIEHWQDDHFDMIDPMQVIVCTDLWYLNDAPMMRRPTIAVGRPGHNAATAFLANRLPEAFSVSDLVHMHFDPEYVEQAVCVWGKNEEATASAGKLFADRYLERFLQSVHLMPMAED